MESPEAAQQMVQLTLHGVLQLECLVCLCLDYSLVLWLMRFAFAQVACAVVEPGSVAARSKPRLALVSVLCVTVPALLLHAASTGYWSTAPHSAFGSTWPRWLAAGSADEASSLRDTSTASAVAAAMRPEAVEANANLSWLVATAWFITFAAAADRITGVGLLALDFTIALVQWVLVASERGVFDPHIWRMVPTHAAHGSDGDDDEQRFLMTL